ncbi:MAG: Spx/MgsR family RNA polymerase-binding regulatory protein [Akkermansiaceae bacterium]|nr:Spx/MgsR family RNA polymerase-binding regulatory protein [Akkermansiaceae bacterium]
MLPNCACHISLLLYCRDPWLRHGLPARLLIGGLAERVIQHGFERAIQISSADGEPCIAQPDAQDWNRDHDLHYQKCSTCRNAIQWLQENDIAHQTKAIRETPPSIAELETALAAAGGRMTAIFNTSGNDYRELELKDKLPTMSHADAMKLLTGNGNLVKRPFLIGEGKVLVGFKQDAWKATLREKTST